ncbi:MAG: DUF3307 domain-containing protein [Bacillota bacterium]
MIITAAIAHLVGDFFFQTKRVSIGKSTLSGMLVHVLLVFIAQILVFLLYRELNTVTFAAISLATVIHFGIDRFRTGMVKAKQNRDTFLFFLADQASHLLVFIAIFYCFKLPVSPYANLPYRVWPYKAWPLLLLLNTYMISFLLYYLQKDLKINDGIYKRDYPGFIERIIITVFLLFPNYLLAFLGIVVKNGLVFAFSKKIDYWEALLGSALAFLFTFGAIYFLR